MAVHYEPPRQNRGGSLRELLMSENQGPSFGSQLGNVLSQEFARQQAAKDQQAQMLAERNVRASRRKRRCRKRRKAISFHSHVPRMAVQQNKNFATLVS